MKYNIDKIVEDHNSMKNWHETMAKSAAEMMQDHIKAATWHESQSTLMKSMMNEVPLDPDKKVNTIPTSGSATTPPSGRGMSPSAQEVPLDPKAMKKSDLVAILEDHVQKYGDFDIDVDTIANFLITE